MQDLSKPDPLTERMRASEAEHDAEEAAKSRGQRAREQADAKLDILRFSVKWNEDLARGAQRHGDADAVRHFAHAAVASRRALAALVVRERVAARPRARGAGRPRAAATRSSARSGDSGDDDPPPAVTGALRPVAVEDARRVLARAARRMLAEAS